MDLVFSEQQLNNSTSLWVLESALRTVFDVPPLDQQPNHLLHINAENNALSNWTKKYIEENTLRGKNLAKYPLRIISVHTHSREENGFKPLDDVSSKNQDCISLLSYSTSHQAQYQQAIATCMEPGEQPFVLAGFVNGESRVQIQNDLSFWQTVKNPYGAVFFQAVKGGLPVSVENKDIVPASGLDAFLMIASGFGLFPKADAYACNTENTASLAIGIGHFEWREYRARLANKSDLKQLTELERCCWPHGLRMTQKTLLSRIKKFAQGQVVIEQNNTVLGVIYTHKINDKAQLNQVTGHTVDQLHQNSGKVVQLLAVNVDPKQQHRRIGDQLLEFMLQRGSAMDGVTSVVGVTRCKDFPKHTEKLDYADYIHLRNSQGRLVDTVLRFHELHGGTVERLMSGYRPKDKSNQGNGVLITYDIRNRRRLELDDSGKASPADSIAPPDDVKETIRLLIRERLDVVVTEDELLNTPLMELGLDSGDLLELTESFSQQFGLSFSAIFFFEHNTCKSVSETISAELILRSETENSHRAVSEKTDYLEGPEATDEKQLIVNDVAIIGISCRLPGGIENPDDFWTTLIEGRDPIGPLPEGRWQWPQGIDPASSHRGIDQGGFIRDIARFDAAFFRISPAEAELMDPQQRLMLELSWACIEDAGYPASSLSGSDTGVFIGVSGTDYQSYSRTVTNEVEAHSSLATSMAVLPNRISYFFDFTGPSISVDTACSSSLVAVYEAAQALRLGRCQSALVGGINLMCHSANTQSYYKAGMLSHDARCKSFDQAANGYVRSEGAVMLLLKPLSQAIADGDSIHGLIKGGAINHGGQSSGLTVPHPGRQADLIVAAYQDANVHPQSISYVEAHGTGTPLGDPIELKGLVSAFSRFPPQQSSPQLLSPQLSSPQQGHCNIGSVKSNVGHLEAASGVVGLLKVLLSMRHKTLPANLHFNQLNPKIDLSKSSFKVLDSARKWTPTGGEKRRAGVSSFGSGGCNAHIVVEEFIPQRTKSQRPSAEKIAVPISAKSKASLKNYIKDLLAFINTKDVAIEDLAYTLQTRRECMAIRFMVLVDSLDDLKSKLSQYLGSASSHSDIFEGCVKNSAKNSPEAKTSVVELDLQNETSLRICSERWVIGELIDWDSAYGELKPEYIHLPTYAFARNQYWLNAAKKTTSTSALSSATKTDILHPLLHKNVSDLSGQKFTAVLNGSESFLRDHVVAGNSVFPGVAYIEMARAALSQSLPGLQGKFKPIVLKNIIFSQPIIFRQSPIEICVNLKQLNPAGFSFEIKSRQNHKSQKNDEDQILNAQGRLFDLSSAERPSRNVNDLLGKCAKTISAATCYSQLECLGFNYGETHRVLNDISVNFSGLGQLISQLSLPASLVNPRGYGLHPSVLDGALQAAVMLLLVQDEQLRGTVMPFSIEAMQVYAPVQSSLYVIVDAQTPRETKVHKHNIDLVDDQGKVCVRILGMNCRKLEKKPQNHTGSKDREFPLIAQPYWQDSPILGAETATTAETAFAQRLVILCEVEEGVESQIPLDTRVKCVRLVAEGNELEEKYSGYAAQILSYSQDLLAQKIRTQSLIQLVVPSQGKEAIHAALIALLKCVELENPKIKVQLVGIDSSLGGDKLNQLLSAEAQCPTTEVRYLNGERQTLCYRDLSQTFSQEITPNYRWKNGGVYLITGGLGGLGDLLAQHIAQSSTAAKLILTGRSKLQQKHTAQLNKIRTLGASVEYISLDICDKNAIADLVENIVRDHGGLTGVFHVAGVLHDSFLFNKTETELRAVFYPKVQGLIALDEAVRQYSPEMFINFSSTSGAFGNIGQADYAAANTFMDSYAAYQGQCSAAGQSATNMSSINWPLWESGGMQVSDATRARMYQSNGMAPLTSQQGFKALEFILSQDTTQFVVLAGDKRQLSEKLLKISAVTKASPVEVSKPAVIVSVDNSGLAQDIEKILVESAAQILKVDKDEIDTESEFSEFGFDSIMLTSLGNLLNEQYAFDLPPTAFFEYRNIEDLRDHLVAGNIDQGHTESRENLLAVDRSKNSLVNSSVLSETVQRTLVELVAELLKVDPSDVDTETELSEFGFDSIMLTAYSNLLNERFTIETTPTVFFEFGTLTEIGHHLIAVYGDALKAELLNSEQLDEEPLKEDPVNKEPQASPVKVALPKPAALTAPTDTQSPEPIAIIGISGHFPESPDLHTLWQNLLADKDCISEIPDSRWNWDQLYGDPATEDNKTDITRAGIIDEMDKFDPLFFGISPNEARSMDPQQRLILSYAWKALEDAGYAAKDLNGSDTGVFVGTFHSGYSQMLVAAGASIEANDATGIVSSIGPSRISHLLNLHGPSEPVETACSSALIAVLKAVQAIRSKRCAMVIAGGVNTLVNPNLHVSFSKAGMLSKDAKCKTFSNKADGYARGEGAGMLILKSLAAAARDGDNIYAVIRGGAENHNGKSNSLGAPNPKAQVELIQAAYKNSAVDPATISYIETNGVGTELGDAIEFQSLNAAFKKMSPSVESQSLGLCGLGSVKTNLGNLEYASGMAAIAKVVLQLQHKRLVASIHCDEVSPLIKLAGSPFHIVRKSQDWKTLRDDAGKEIPRRAGISSFGFSGVNAHLVLEEYIPQNHRQTTGEQGAKASVILVSAKDKDGLIRQVEQLIEALDCSNWDDADLPDIAYTLQVGRTAFDTRLAFSVETLIEFKQNLVNYLADKNKAENLFRGNASEHKDIVNLFKTEAELKSIVTTWLQSGKLSQFMRLWVMGLNFDWKHIYADVRRKRVSLPSYPFALKRYWIACQPQPQPQPQPQSQPQSQPQVSEEVPHAAASSASIANFDASAVNARLAALLEDLLGVPNSYFDSGLLLSALGFSSIHSLSLKHKIEQIFQIEMPLAKISNGNVSIQELSLCVEDLITINTSNRSPDNSDQQISTETVLLPVIDPAPQHAHIPFPLTDIQESYAAGRLLGESSDIVGAHLYLELNMQTGMDIRRLRQSWQHVMQRHSILHTCLQDDGTQQVMSKVPLYRIKVVDLREMESTEADRKQQQIRQQLETKVYLASHWPLFEICLSLRADQPAVVHLSIDELIIDAASLQTLLNDWSHYYRDPEVILPELSLTFRDYVLAIKAFEKTPRSQRDMRYWMQTLNRVPSGPQFPLEQNSPALTQEKYKRNRLQQRLSTTQWQSLQAQAQNLSVSPTVLLLGIFSEVLRSQSESECFSLLLTFLNRPPIHPQISELLGPIISTNIFVVPPRQNLGLDQDLQSYQQRLMADLDHASVGGVRVLRELKNQKKIDRSFSLPVVFTSMLNSFSLDPFDSDLIFDKIELSNQTPQVFLDHQVREEAGELIVSWDVAEKVYPSNFMRRLFDQYCRVLLGLSEQRLSWEYASFSAPELKLNATENVADNNTQADVEPVPTSTACNLSESFDLTDQQQAYAFGRSQHHLSGAQSSCQLYQSFSVDNLNISALRRALNSVVAAHPMLRVSITAEGRQRVLSDIPIYEIRQENLTHLSASQKHQAIDHVQSEMLQRVAPLDGWPYFELRVSRMDQGQSMLHLCVDLIIADASSIHLIVEQLFACYQDTQLKISPPKWDFSDYIASVNKFKKTADLSIANKYWTEKFSNIPNGPLLQSISSDTSAASENHQRLSANLSDWKILQQRAVFSGITLSELMLAVYLEVLFVANDKQSLTVVVPCWDRLDSHADINAIVGDFTAMAWVSHSGEKLSILDRAKHLQSQIRNDLDLRPISGLSVLRRISMKNKNNPLVFPIVFTNSIFSLNLPYSEVNFVDAISKTPHVALDNMSMTRDSDLQCAWDMPADRFNSEGISLLFNCYIQVLIKLRDDAAVWNQVLPVEFANLGSQLGELNRLNRVIQQESV